MLRLNISSGTAGWAHDLGAMLGRSRTVVAEARVSNVTCPAVPMVAWPQRCCRGWPAWSTSRPDADTAAIEDEFSSASILLESGAADVLWPADTCPDNAVLDSDGWWFLDLEATDVGHAALAAAYMVLPFATCWCVFDPPPGLTDELLAAFTTGLAAYAPEVVGGPDWRRQVTIACAAYVRHRFVFFLSGDGVTLEEMAPLVGGPTRR